uniref:Type VI secretion system protein VasK n=1 Tax=Macrostomum lignano TaxID=282301 RepID=A0A1I8FNX2_9PLAT
CFAFAQRERQLRFAQPPSYAELANQRQQILAAYRGIPVAVRLAGGCLLAATLTALICGHSVAQSALAIDCATRAATIDEEPMRLRNFSAGQLLRSSIVQMVQCESCQIACQRLLLKAAALQKFHLARRLLARQPADTWLWRSEADLIAYLPSAAWNVADLKSHTDWWSVMSKHLSAMLTTNSTAAVRAIGLTVSFYTRL